MTRIKNESSKIWGNNVVWNNFIYFVYLFCLTSMDSVLMKEFENIKTLCQNAHLLSWNNLHRFTFSKRGEKNLDFYYK